MGQKGVVGYDMFPQKHPLTTCLLITTETNRQTDATCISPEEMSGAPHVPFEGLQIGPNKAPQK